MKTNKIRKLLYSKTQTYNWTSIKVLWFSSNYAYTAYVHTQIHLRIIHEFKLWKNRFPYLKSNNPAFWHLLNHPPITSLHPMNTLAIQFPRFNYFTMFVCTESMLSHSLPLLTTGVLELKPSYFPCKCDKTVFAVHKLILENIS